MNIKQIVIFQAIAQYGSISEASRHLFIVQPALSRQIQQLENVLGVSLFIRRKKGIELTPAGEQLLKDSSLILQSIDQATTNVRRVGGIKETIHLGIAPTYTWNPIILDIIHSFSKTNPNTNISLEPTLSITQSDRLSQGMLDAGFMAWRQKADKTKHGIGLMKCRLLIAHAKNSPIKSMRLDTLDDLKQHKFLFFPREMSPEFYDFMFLQCKKANFKPDIVESGTDFNACLAMVSSGLGFTIISSASRYNCPSNIELIEHPLLSEYYDLEFVYRTPVQKKILQNLIDFIK